MDALGRLERVRIAPGTCMDGNEDYVADELRAANMEARRAAQDLEFGQPETRSSTNNGPVDETDFYDEPDSFLQ